VYFASQSVLDEDLHRLFIKEALCSAAEVINSDGSLEAEPVIEEDTALSNTSEIWASKIENSDIFVCDITPVPTANRPLSPDPVVQAKLAHALKTIGSGEGSSEKIIAVLNLATGNMDSLPFFLATSRVTRYRLEKDDPKLNSEKKLLVNTFALVFKQACQQSEKN
jgi:hypothetical protein